MNTTSYTTSPRVAGALFLLIASIGIVTNFVIKPAFYAKNYLTALATEATTLKLTILADIVCGALTIWASILLLPIFLTHSKRLSYGFLGFRLTGYTLTIGEGIFALSLLSLSQYLAENQDTNQVYLKLIGESLKAIHEWTHLLRILLSALPIFFFYLITYRYRLLPQFISIWGFLALPLMATRMLLNIVDLPTSNFLLAPLALNQLFLAAWMLVKGFMETSSAKTNA